MRSVGSTTSHPSPDRMGLAYDAAALLALVLVVFVFFTPVTLGDRYIPSGGGDLASFIYPMYRFIAGSISSGDLPLWNPHQYAGAPLAADNQSGMFYPVNLLLFAVLPNFPYAALEGLAMLHMAWAGVCAYACFRLWRPGPRLVRWAAVFGAIAFMLSDVFVTHLGNLNLIAVASWLPLALLGANRAVEAESARARACWSLTAGTAMGVGALAGHGQASFLVASLVGLYAVARMITDKDWRPIGVLGLAGLTALGVSALSVFPALAAQDTTVRATFDYSQSTRYSVPVPALAGMVAPDFYGRGPARYRGDWDRVEVGYAGVLTLLLAAVAMAKVHDRRTGFFAGAALLALLLALGPATPLHRWLLSPWSLPFQAPARFVLVTDFCLAFLAAIGLDNVMRSRSPELSGVLKALGLGSAVLLTGLCIRLRSMQITDSDALWAMRSSLLVLGTALAAGLVLLVLRDRGIVRPWAFGPLAAILLAAELIGLGYNVETDPLDPTSGYRREGAVRFLASDGGLHRIDSATAKWQPGAAQMVGLYDIGGVYNPLQLGIYKYYIDGLRFRGSTPYNLLGAKYVVADKSVPPSDQAFIVRIEGSDPDVDLYLNERAYPRAWLVHEVLTVWDDAEAYEQLHDPSFDPRTTLVLVGRTGTTGGLPDLGGAATASSRPVDSHGGWRNGQAPSSGRSASDLGPAAGELDRRSAEITAYEPDQIVVEVETDRPAYLVISDMYHPDWRAWVDGAPVDILRADFAFRAVPVAEGRHEVRMSYEPAGWRLGVAVSLLSTIAVFLALSMTPLRAGPRQTTGGLTDRKSGD